MAPLPAPVPHVDHDQFVDQRRSFLTDHMYVALDRQLRAFGQAFYGFHTVARMDAAADRNRTGEAQLVRAVVQDVVVAGQLVARLLHHLRQQRQREKAVRDRGAERALLLAALRIGVDPVMVTREIRETVDQVLRDLDLAAPGAEIR